MLELGYHDVAAGHTASVVTHLEMYARPELRPQVEAGFVLERVETPSLEWYRAMIRKVGAEYLWCGRLEMSDEALGAVLSSSDVHVHIMRKGGEEIGLMELDFRSKPDCELAYFGVIAEGVGSGAGRWLMNRAIERAWAAPIERFHVHTCTLDHPSALAFYIRSGFTPYRRQVEIVADPRLSGLLPEGAAPQVPKL